MTQPGQETARRWDDAHVSSNRFQDNARNLVRELVEKRFNSTQVIEGSRECILSRSGGHTRAIGQAQSRHARARLNQEHIAVAMIATLELDNLVPASIRSRQTKRTHSSLGARVDKAHHLDTGNQLDHEFSQLGLQRRRRTVTGAFGCRLSHCLDDGWMSMAQDQRPPRQYIVDVPVAILIPQIGAFTPSDEGGLSAHRTKGPYRAVHTSRYDFLGGIQQSLRPVQVHVSSSK